MNQAACLSFSRCVLLLVVMGQWGCQAPTNLPAQGEVQVASVFRDNVLSQPQAMACSGCHGANGSPVDLTTLPSAVIVSRLREFQEDHVANTVMGRIARGYTDEELELIAQAWGQ